MELNEAFRRILGRYWWLIYLFVALGVGLGAVVHRGSAETYTASTRLVLDTQDPRSSAESTVIADTARAIATSPSQVKGALVKAHVTGRDSVDVANHVSVRALGSSGVLQLSVSDRSPRVAADISNALAAGSIQTRLAVTKGEVQQVLTGLDQRIADLNRRISSIDSYIESLNVRAASARTSERANVLRAARTTAERSRDFLAQQRGVVESERVSLLSTDAFQPKPSIISRATPPDHADPSRRLPDMLLGALLGLVLGVGLAGLVETIRPTLIGGDALAREFDTPLLGTLPRNPDAEEALKAARGIAPRLRLAAQAAGLRNVGLLAAGPGVDLGRVAERLEAVFDGAKPVLAEAEPEQTVEVGPFDLQNASMNGGGTGLVLVSPSALKKTEVANINHLLRVTPSPLLGLITCTGRRWSRVVGGQPRDEL